MTSSSEFAVNTVLFPQETQDPTVTSGSGKFYTKGISGSVQQFFESDDGTVFQLTPVVASDSSVTYPVLTHIITFAGGTTLANNTNVQGIFSSSRDSIVLSASTTYKMNALIIMDKGANNVVTHSLIFSSSATFTTFEYFSKCYQFANDGLSTNTFMNFLRTTGSAVVTASGRFYKLYINGIFITNTSGSMVPQIQYSASPGATGTVNSGSYFELIPMGSSSFVQQGGWS